MSNTVKKVIVIGGVALITNVAVPQQSLECISQQADIIIRTGEYENKPGKRLEGISKDFDIDLPIRYENGKYCVQEHDFNYKVAKALVNYLKMKDVNVILQNTQSKKEDLNSAGRIAKQYNPKIYLSIHHNSYAKDSTGYFFMTNGDSQSVQYAKKLSNVMTSNPMLIPQRENQINNGYIGELNQKPGAINILGELGFALSNPNEAKKCASDEQVNYIAKTLGDELIKILQELNN